MSLADYKEAKKNYREAKSRYENNPTMDNAAAMLTAKEAIVLLIAVFVIAALLGGAITSLNETNTSGWTTAQIALFGVVGVIIIAVIIMKISE